MKQMSIKALRHNKGLTQATFAKAVGVSRKTAGQWERGESVPMSDKIPAICSALDVSYDEIRWGT